LPSFHANAKDSNHAKENAMNPRHSNICIGPRSFVPSTTEEFQRYKIQYRDEFLSAIANARRHHKNPRAAVAKLAPVGVPYDGSQAKAYRFVLSETFSFDAKRHQMMNKAA
jgi:hypothetical protein